MRLLQVKSNKKEREPNEEIKSAEEKMRAQQTLLSKIAFVTNSNYDRETDSVNPTNCIIQLKLTLKVFVFFLYRTLRFLVLEKVRNFCLYYNICWSQLCKVSLLKTITLLLWALPLRLNFLICFFFSRTSSEVKKIKINSN